MSTNPERVNQLHEQASECYLNGDYQGALAAWGEVLQLSPDDEQALDGVRMASQFVEPEAATVVAHAPAIEDDLDQGLRILDGVGAPTMLSPEPIEDLLDRKPLMPFEEPPAAEEIPEGWDATSESSAGEGSFGLEPFSRTAPAPAAPASAAAAELKRRVADLLTEAKAKAEAGERDEALAILARLGILDEENAEAEALRLKIEAAGASDLDKVEQAIIEGVAALEADRLDDAERLFREALALSPEHREAQHYLEKVAERRAAPSEDLLGGLDGESAPAEDAVERATAAAATAAKAVPLAAKPPRPEPAPLPEIADAPLAGAGPRFALPPSKILLYGALGAVLLVGAATTLPHLFHRSTPKFTAPKPAAAAPKVARAAKAGPAAKPAAQPAVPVLSPEERARAITGGLAKGESLLEAGDGGAAVLAFNDVLALDPTNAAAKSGLNAAGDQYKATKAERDALNTIKLAFRDGEFTSALRLAYRLPPSVSKSYTDGIKVAGWYNLAVVALRAGDCHEAQSHLDEALTVVPSDPDAKSLREFAARYADAVKDRAFLDHVEALSFRPLPSS